MKYGLAEQLHGHTFPKRIVHLGNRIGFSQQLRDGLRGSRRLDRCPVGDAGCGEPYSSKGGRGFNLDVLQGDAQTTSFAIQVVAVASGKRQHEELSPVDTGATGRLGWDH